MKIDFQLVEEDKFLLEFEFMPRELTWEERRSLLARMRDATKSHTRIPVNLVSHFQLDEMWRSGAGANRSPAQEIGWVESITLIALVTDPTRIKVKGITLAGDFVSNRINRYMVADGAVKENVVVFPRMQVMTEPASLILPGETSRRMKFKEYGQILAIDIVYDVQNRQILQSIGDANYAKKHRLDIMPK